MRSHLGPFSLKLITRVIPWRFNIAGFCASSCEPKKKKSNIFVICAGGAEPSVVELACLTSLGLPIGRLSAGWEIEEDIEVFRGGGGSSCVLAHLLPGPKRSSLMKENDWDGVPRVELSQSSGNWLRNSTKPPEIGRVSK